MIRAYLSQAANWSGAELLGKDAEFEGVSIDSRRVSPGSLFVALKGAHLDGHDFLDDAKLRGASGALVSSTVNSSLPVLLTQDPLSALGKLATTWRRNFDLPVIGVLGSNGKTTVKEMTTAILRQHFGDTVLATQGNQNNELGVPLNLLRLDSNYRAAVIELGANGHGEITRLGNMARPSIAVITNSGLDHIAGFGGREGSAHANGEIFSTMDSTGIAILNGDDEYLSLWRQQAGLLTCLSFGFKPGADVQGNWHPEIGCNRLTINSPSGKIECRLALMGQHNAVNALAAASVCLALGIDLETIAIGLAGVRPIDGRLKPQLSASGARIIDDTYNANPSSLLAALETLSRLPGRKMLILGDMSELGKESENWHVWAGQAARSVGVENVFALGKLARIAVESFGDGAYHFTDAKELVKALQPHLHDGVHILVKGSRCMALETIVRKLL